VEEEMRAIKKELVWCTSQMGSPGYDKRELGFGPGEMEDRGGGQAEKGFRKGRREGAMANYQQQIWMSHVRYE